MSLSFFVESFILSHMKKVLTIALISLSALSLTSCGKEISYEKWKELAEAKEDYPYTSVTIKYSLTSSCSIDLNGKTVFPPHKYTEQRKEKYVRILLTEGWHSVDLETGKIWPAETAFIKFFINKYPDYHCYYNRDSIKYYSDLSYTCKYEIVNSKNETRGSFKYVFNKHGYITSFKEKYTSFDIDNSGKKISKYTNVITYKFTYSTDPIA